MTLRLGSPEQFARLRDFLEAGNYTERAILSGMRIARMSEAPRMHTATEPSDRLELLIQLFLLGHLIPLRIVGEFVPAEMLSLWAELGLVSSSDEEVMATVDLYPCHSLYIASDRTRKPDLAEAGENRVFSAITSQTEEFLAMLPDSPCPAFLDLGCGTGIAGLWAARHYAVQSFAFDISERSTHFAEFNRRLNRVGNLTIGCGDLYRPAGRRTFDRIAAHPPYVPSLRPTLLLRDGGEDGEFLTRRIIEGLPSYLHPGGRFYGLALVASIRNDPFADRVRRWLLEAQAEFDVGVIVRKAVDPERLIFDNWAAHAEAGDLQRWESILTQRRIEAFHYVTLILERHATSRPAVTVVRRAGEPYDPQEVEAVLRWEQAGAAVDDLRPRTRPEIEMQVRRSLSDGTWGPAIYEYSLKEPFRSSREGPEWIGQLLAGCDGIRTCRELFELSRPPVPYPEFTKWMRDLIGQGFLQVPTGAV